MSPEASKQPFASRDKDKDASLVASVHRRRQRAKAEATPDNILLFIVAFRVLNALSVHTFFQPDEYFQSLEPAWQIVFGKESGAWITWVSDKYPGSGQRLLLITKKLTKNRVIGVET